MSERRDNAFGQTARPNVEYHLDRNDSRLPFVFEINGDKLGQLLVEEMGFSEDRVRSLVFRVTSLNLPIGFEVSVTPDGISSEVQVLHGRTHLKDGDMGKQVMLDIHTGATSEGLMHVRDEMVDYSYLSKQKGLTPRIQQVTKDLEGRVLNYKGERMREYLRAVDWERARRFLDRLSAIKFRKEVVGVVVHEVNHIDDAIGMDNISRKINRRERIRNFTFGGGVGMVLIGVFNIATGNQGAGTLDIAASTLVLGGAGFAKIARERGIREHRDLQIDSEERARAAAKSKADRWRDVIVVRPNPNYAD